MRPRRRRLREGPFSPPPPPPGAPPCPAPPRRRSTSTLDLHCLHSERLTAVDKEGRA